MKIRKLRLCPFILNGRAVHVWPVRLAASSSVAEQFQPLLCPDERDRAAHFHFDHLRRSFIVARGSLRVLLGCYLRLPADAVEFQYGPAGKPALAAASPIHFNASHSGDLALFAFTTGLELGVDVEHIRPLPEMQSIAARFFCPEETTELQSCTANLRERAFYLCWTRKEAYIKAVGDGLSAPLDNFRVTLQPGQPARFVHFAHDPAAQAWTLHDLTLTSEYAAALAYRESERPVTIAPVFESLELLNLTKFSNTRSNASPPAAGKSL